jgi:hypothetical protein
MRDGFIYDLQEKAKAEFKVFSFSKVMQSGKRKRTADEILEFSCAMVNKIEGEYIKYYSEDIVQNEIYKKDLEDITAKVSDALSITSPRHKAVTALHIAEKAIALIAAGEAEILRRCRLWQTCLAFAAENAEYCDKQSENYGDVLSGVPLSYFADNYTKLTEENEFLRELLQDPLWNLPKGDLLNIAQKLRSITKNLLWEHYLAFERAENAVMINRLSGGLTETMKRKGFNLTEISEDFYDRDNTAEILIPLSTVYNRIDETISVAFSPYYAGDELRTRVNVDFYDGNEGGYSKSFSSFANETFEKIKSELTYNNYFSDKLPTIMDIL